MTCMYCQGEMVRGNAPFHIDRNGVDVTLDSIPAWTCKQCGEAYFEEREVHAIQEIVNTVDEKAEKLVRSM